MSARSSAPLSLSALTAVESSNAEASRNRSRVLPKYAAGRLGIPAARMRPSIHSAMRRVLGPAGGRPIERRSAVERRSGTRASHDQHFDAGDQDGAASRLRFGGRQGGVRSPARRAAAARRLLLRGLRCCGPAHRPGARRGTAGHDDTGGLLARAGPRGKAGRGDSRGRHGEGARARRRGRPAGGHRHRPGRQRPRAAARPMRTTPRAGSSRHGGPDHYDGSSEWGIADRMEARGCSVQHREKGSRHPS